MVLKTFKRGGVHPEEYKLSAGEPIRQMALPGSVAVQLSQSIGPPSVPVVAKGDRVLTGQVIAEGNAFISAHLHAPVSGTVTRIDDFPDVSGYRRRAILIEAGGDEWAETINRDPAIDHEIRLSPGEIVAKVKEMGLVGMGGASFPTHVKLKVPEGKKADYLVINGVECEPYLTSDHRLMLERGEELLIGIRIIMKALGAGKAFIGIENNKPDAISQLEKRCSGSRDIEVVPLKVRYPQGGEKQLIKAILGREVPSGKLPVDVGCVVQNVGTALAVYEAVQKNKPLIERVVTVTGNGVNHPGNLLARIGTPVSVLIAEAGGAREDCGKIINGGPMMGKALPSFEVPVVKGMSGLLLLSGDKVRRPAVMNCIRCARCTFVCPMGLEPFLIAQHAGAGKAEDTEVLHVMDCIECGSCAYTCPAGRPLLDSIRIAKQKVGHLIRTRTK